MRAKLTPEELFALKCLRRSQATRIIEPLADRVLIRRIEEKKGLITLTDADKSLKGEVLAVGPGKRDEDGELVALDVKPGDLVYFSSKWNDLAKDHYDDLPLETDPLLHLVQEADILGRIS